MELLTDSKLGEVLRSQNPWWSTGALPNSARHTQPRSKDGFLRETTRPALLVGPRRCGKTATLLRLLDAHLRGGGSPRRVAYLPLDHPLLRLLPLGPLVDRLSAFLDGTEGALLLLDGLQAVPEWPARFLELVKTRPQPRIVAASAMRPELQDSSFDVVVLPTLRFREFCDLRGIPGLGAPPLDLLDPRLPAAVDPADDYLFDRILDPALADYLVRGGFPASVREPELPASQREIRDEVVARAVYQDLPNVVGVLKLADVERVLLAALLARGRPLTVEAFADTLALDRQTVGRYLEHLQRAFLVTSLKNFAASTDRSRPRFFPVDPGLPNALLERGAAVLAQPAERGSLLSGAVVAHVEDVARERGFDIAYFRDGDAEADVVLVSPEGVVPVLIVDREEVGEADAVSAERIMKKLQAKT
ncbi:MAG: ATP-binding protein, partial [Planctomycetota bacterium]